MAKNKKLTLSHIIKENKKFNEINKIIFNDGTYLHINKYFSIEKIDLMLESFGKTMAEVEKSDIELDKDNIINFLMLHVFKFFSSLGSDIPDDLQTKIIVFRELLKSDYAEKLAESYDTNEIGKVFDRIFKKIELVGKTKEIQDEFRKQLMIKIDEMENAEIIREVMFGDGEDGESIQEP